MHFLAIDRAASSYSINTPPFDAQNGSSELDQLAAIYKANEQEFLRGKTWTENFLLEEAKKQCPRPTDLYLTSQQVTAKLFFDKDNKRRVHFVLRFKAYDRKTGKSVTECRDNYTYDLDNKNNLVVQGSVSMPLLKEKQIALDIPITYQAPNTLSLKTATIVESEIMKK